jgi:hypothetical protein
VNDGNMNDGNMNDGNMNEERDMNELGWRAFRYAAGEMGADEALAFEAKLAGDQEACEALSRAVELGLTLAQSRLAQTQSTQTQPATISLAPARRTGRGLRAAMWALPTAAAVAAAWFYATRTPPRDGGPEPATVAGAGVPARAVDEIAWLQVRQIGDGSTPIESPPADEGLGELLESELRPDRGPAIPSWMVDVANANRGKGNHE